MRRLLILAPLVLGACSFHAVGTPQMSVGDSARYCERLAKQQASAGRVHVAQLGAVGGAVFGAAIGLSNDGFHPGYKERYLGCMRQMGWEAE